ncbi:MULTISPECIES: alternate F1F0 ATPase, F1 subunit alpha [Cyanophyceae]|uniref:alternate F1F0 ATPase, F1 subunit alpha n=1 Tax=Cyanophyceae TaxID=3028117 RepID=UPI00232B2C9F|nr:MULTISPECIES: alternate F1F0 ATPase, F1 subunit alpha [Cyanophyceae]MDB9356966.1 alternate F1F0 ATPase, F1 subunit alpha [Nodularia spumigena CS-587/03]MDB9339403.1 alternate F1F0 ATPase, F1 subunit alpha [Nodularia spumigena CS-589/07]MDB9401293.1 alternate F1F0 ATPase, F1 subunit alpha [Microcystis aeruginosa CS-567/02-A1]MDB9500403.1 alternate F1F0 ATPase, F1 subunit alpha [Nodularia spumigena CS-336/02]MDB9531723.1 alternate F1F0 ATPase, F1 subunit alpha [Nodularia spumigena CS-1038]
MNKNPLQTLLNKTFTTFEQVLNNYQPQIQTREIGIIKSLTQGIANISGLPNVKADELLRFSGDVLGIAFNLDANEIGVILLGNSQHLAAGQEVQRTERVLDVPVGEALLGRVLDVTGNPLDNQGAIQVTERRPVERQAAAIMDRAPVTVPLQAGIKVVDALVPIGRGQRELIVGDRQIGKTAIATDTIINQKHQNVICIYCAIGKRASAVAKVIADLRQHNAMDYSIVIVASGEDPPGLQYITPYAATTIAEYFMEKGRDVLIVYDDLTHHAWAYRELSLLLRRPPGREAYPGDIFYIHSRLLERATHLRPELGGGSLTALPIVETQAQNISAYIPTNLISITDGQIYLSPDLFQKGVLPAVDVGKSVSRVGGKTQLPAYSAVAGDLRLSYSQFQEVEVFARFGTQLDEETRQTLERGRRVREILKQPQYQPLPVAEQIAVLLAVTEGIFDDIPLDKIEEAARAVRQQVTEQLSEVSGRIQAGEKLSDQDRNALLSVAQGAIAFLKSQEESENAHH